MIEAGIRGQGLGVRDQATVRDKGGSRLRGKAQNSLAQGSRLFESAVAGFVVSHPFARKNAKGWGTRRRVGRLNG